MYTKSVFTDELLFFRRRGHSEYESKPQGGMCRDVRLETNPTLQVVRENLGVQRLETDPTLQVVRENLGVQRLETDPTLEVVRENLGVQRLETDPTLQVVRENLGVQQSPQVTCQEG